MSTEAAPSEPFASLALADGVAHAVVAPEHAVVLCAGHFPDAPLLPGAALAGLMADVGRWLLTPEEGPVQPVGLLRCVFMTPVIPRDAITVVARRHPDHRDLVDAEVHTAAGCAARATIRFAARR